MAYQYRSDGTIVVPRGDTVTLSVGVTGGGIQDGDAVIFRVYSYATSSWILTKIATISGGRAEVHLTSADTRSLSTVTKYGWIIGVVVGLDYDSDNQPISNDLSDTVITANTMLSNFVVTNGVLGINS